MLMRRVSYDDTWIFIFLDTNNVLLNVLIFRKSTLISYQNTMWHWTIFRDDMYDTSMTNKLDCITDQGTRNMISAISRNDLYTLIASWYMKGIERV